MRTIIRIFLICAFMSPPLFSPAVGNSTSKIIVVEGQVICFDLLKEPTEETTFGNVINLINEETCNVDVMELGTVPAYIPQEYRDQIVERLQPGVYVYLLKNIRRIKQTEWDIIAVGTIVKAGNEYSHGIVREAVAESLQAVREIAPEPSISMPTPIPEAVTINKKEEILEKGEGPVITQKQTEEQATTVQTPPSEPTPPTPAPTLKQYYWVNPTGIEYQIGEYTIAANGQDSSDYDGSNEQPWRSITYALTRVTGSDIQLVGSATNPATFSTSTGETFPLNMKNNVNLIGQGAGSSIIDGTSGGTQGIILCNGITATIRNMTIQNGSGSTNYGGGITLINNSNVTISSVAISGNTNTNGSGGGCRAIGGTASFSNCTFTSNHADATGYVGGGLYILSSNITISSGCTFTDNSSYANGGAISWFDNGTGSLTISDSTFNGNNRSSTYGGTIYLAAQSGQVGTIQRTKIYNNTSPEEGGAIFVFRGNISIINCLLYGNTTSPISALGRGGGIIIATDGSANIINCTINGNTPSGLIVVPSSYTLKNCILYNNTAYGICGNWGESWGTIDNNCIYGNPSGIAVISATTYANTQAGMDSFNGVTPNNNVWTNPQLSADYKLTASTPNEVKTGGTSTGAPSDDLEGYSRSSPPSMGCYERRAGDPSITGKVYDSVTGETISSPVVSIYNATTNAQVGVTTSNPFTFNVDAGKYYLAVSKSGYAYPSQIASSTTSGDHGDIFTAGSDPLTINIPMDPDGWLVVEKTCNKERVEIGDIVTYRIKVQNKHWYKSVENVELIDELVNGFKYVSSPNFNLGTVSANSTQTITYQVRVGSAVPPGRYKTNCYTRKTTTGSRNSNIDTTEIEVTENPLFTRGTIIGKIFWDFNGNGVQDKGELGVGGVKIYTEYGVCVETDQDGKYHILNVPAGNHLLKLDTTELPDWVSLTTDNPYYVKITEGLLAKVNFGMTPLTLPSPTHAPRGYPGGEGFFIVALGEGIVRNLDTSGNIAMVEKDDRYDDGLKVDGRLALYLKGKILGKYLIKASLDTDRRTGKPADRRTLFTNLDPDKYYPVYGDASKVDYSGIDTQDIVWVIIEWDNSFAKWGSFHTELPLYNRTLSGGIINYQSIGKTKFGDTRTKIKGFGAFSRQKPAHDEFVGTGGSLYYLRHRDVIEGSEKVRVEVRDRLGKITLNSIPLVEELDYEIDYDSGRILLKRSLNSIQQSYNNSIISNDILMGERVYLVIDYEYYSDGLSDQAYGVNASQWIGNHIRLGGTYVEEQKSGDPYKLMGGDATLKINKDTEVNVNYSRTEETQLGSTISYDGGLTFSEQGEQYSLDKSGSAVTVDGRTKLFGNTDIALTYSRQDPYYSVTSSISSQGSQKYLANIITKITENLSIGLTHLTQKYYEGSIAGTIFGATDSYTTTGILDYRPGKWDIRTEYQHQETKNPFTDYTYFGTLPLLDNDFIAARIGYQLFSWLHPYIRGQVTVNGTANDQGTVGADINIGRNTTINLAETVGTLGDSTLVGLTTKITEGTDVYANLEVGNHTRLGKYTKSTYGQSTQLDPDSKAYIETDYSSYRENIVIGNLLGYKKKITDTLALELTYERSNVKNNTTVIDRDVGAISLSYLNPDWLKAYSKLEVRNDIGSSEIRQWVTQNDILWRTTKWLTLSGRCNWAWTNNEDTDTDQAEFYEVAAGFSLRPVTWDKINILGKYSYLTDQPPDGQWDFPLDIESIKNVYSIEGIYDLFKYLSLVGKFSYRDMSEKVGTYDWIDSDTYLYIARTNFHIGEKGDCPLKKGGQSPFSSFLLRGWDFAVEYRILANDQIEDSKEGFLVELDKDIGPYIRCGVGYNFTDYDDDLRNDDNWDAKGWFFKLAGKY